MSKLAVRKTALPVLLKKSKKWTDDYWFRTHLQEYCKVTTLHGLHHTANNEFSKIERVFWAMVTVFSLGVAGLLAYLLLYRFQRSPTITTVETYSYPTWKIPFPAVTLCNMNRVRKSVVNEMSEKLSRYQINRSDTENYFQKIITLITRHNVEFSGSDQFVEQSVLKEFNNPNSTIEDIMYMVSQPCSELLVHCGWNGLRTDCAKMFRPSKSLDGHCCSFNYNIHGKDRFIDPNQLNPEYIAGTGRSDGLSVVLNTNSEDYYSATAPYFGIRILLHSTDVFPETSLLSEVIQPGNGMKITINPYYVKSEDNVRKLKLSQRLCLFPDESRLLTLNEYDYQQCITECRINIIRQFCNCIPFIYPIDLNSSIMCNLTHAKCLHQNSIVFSNLLPDNANENSESICSRCLPECSEVIYTMTSSIARQPTHNYTISPEIPNNYSVLRIVFQDISCIKYRREAMVTWDTLVASIGGIFGLCLGGSVLSIVELIYYFTIRLYKKIHETNKRQKKIAPLHFLR
ncbi:sodium channel protein Nach-like isoform X2 [Adelges cooleyi]|uniref:sodium channel protein Nach-like isoform X2 n=1 Tax=Adelges cooleyi TaxID=133065 RepID=UPI00217F62EF|nr:sodium channel protein Nach-like isoform X2 [Adelges cooleyi]